MVGSPMVGGGPMVGGPMVGGGQGVRTYYISQEWTEAISCPSLGDTIHAGVLVYGGYNQWSVWAVTEGGGDTTNGSHWVWDEKGGGVLACVVMLCSITLIV